MNFMAASIVPGARGSICKTQAEPQGLGAGVAGGREGA